MKKRFVALTLHDIRSAHNVGAIFRTADALGIDKIFITGYTPAPVDRFGRVVKEIAKTALGGEKNVPWEKISIGTLIKICKKQKTALIAIEQAEGSVDYKKIKIAKDTVFILGNEVTGLPKNILDEVDAIAEISMKGKKESLNVAIAGSIVLFRILNI